MDILGYFLTLSVLRNNMNVFDAIKDVSVTVNEVGTLAGDAVYEISRENDAASKLKNIHDSGYVREGEVGRYYSKNLRDFIFYRNVSAEEEGLKITLYFNNDVTPTGSMVGSKSEETERDVSLFFSSKGIDFYDVEDDINSHYESKYETIV